MPISSSLYRPLIGVIVVLGVAACHDEIIAPTDVPREMSVPGPALRSAAIPGHAVATADEQIAAEYLARTLALSLARADLRLEVKMAIATSVMKDHKLHFASFLQGRGGRIVSAMEGQDRSSVPSVQSAVARVRDLEFYMPVPAHRQQWTGGEDLLVGVGLSEKDSPIAFNTRGERIVLSPTVPPPTPTLFLVPNETDLSAQIALNRQGRAAVTCLAIATESLEAAGARCTGTSNLTLTSSGFVPTVRSSIIAPPSTVSKSFASDPQIVGLHAQFLRVLDDGEPYWMQPPEIEIHIVGKTSREDGTIRDYQCAGELANSFSGYQPGVRDQAYVFDQNDHFWDGSARPVLLLNNWQMDEIQRDDREGFLITVWEDDVDACAIRQDADVSLQDLVDQVENVTIGAKVGVQLSRMAEGVAFMLGMLVVSVAEALAGGDDILGILVDKRQTPAHENNYPDNTHVLLKENGDLAGRATLNVLSLSRYANVSGPTQASPGQQAYFSASTAGTFGALTYTFTASGPDGNGPSVIQSGPASGVYYSNWNQGTYSIGVNVTDSYGSVGASSTLMTIPPGPPTVTASTVNGRVRLSWGAVPGAATYRIYRQLEWQQQAEVWNTVSGTLYDDPSTNVTGPPQSNQPKGQSAKYYVVSRSANGVEGTYSSVHYYPYSGIAPY